MEFFYEIFGFLVIILIEKYFRHDLKLIDIAKKSFFIFGWKV